MISLTAVFGIFIVLFALVGAMRGWSKELLVTSALLLGLFLNTILEMNIELYRNMVAIQSPSNQFLIRSGVVVVLAFFGYQTPQFRFLQPKMVRERLQELLLGTILGAVNGYLLFGTVWFYLQQLGYPTDLVVQPASGTELATRISEMVAYLPPSYLTSPIIYFAVGLVFILVIVVFV